MRFARPDWLKAPNFDWTSWKPWAIALLISGLIGFVWDLTSPTQESTQRGIEDPETASTFIPAGFVLVPIEIENYEALDSILGKFGVVDLFKPATTPGGRPVRVASRVKILRAPLNPSHFAVLAPEAESADLVSHAGSFTVVVQNPNQVGTQFEKSLASEAELAAPTRGPQKVRPHRSRIVVEVTSADEN